MNRPWHVGLIFSVCLVVVLAAMGWISRKVLQLDRAEILAQNQAVLEENVRLALWRMESSIAPLIAQESARPYFFYTPFYPAERAYTRMYAEMQPNEVRLPSPLLATSTQHVLLHFQIEQDGKTTSPQAPSGDLRELARSGYTTLQRIEEAEIRLVKLRTILDRTTMWERLPFDSASPPSQMTVSNAPPSFKDTQSLRSSIEGAKRTNAFQKAAESNWSANGTCEVCPTVREGMMKPMWVKDALILARKVSVNRKEYVQGCELDWPAIRKSLIADISDLLPQADLKPVVPQNGEKQTHMLAALPVQLIPGDVSVSLAEETTPIRISLWIAWLCVLLAATAVGVLLRGVVQLSERRGAFVSAVTHELRTPLTTLRMYAEMLAKQMVPSEQKRAQYLDTMRAEADRLAHLVENVLSFSRLERHRAGGQAVNISLAELLAKIQPRLSQRAEQAGMSIVMPSENGKVSVRADVVAVEQILFNLVDNACKYAATASDRTIHIQCEQRDSQAAVQVSDHGPGIDALEARRLFKPFSKSAHDAANTAPGVGLGLALSRRLARNMGGDLRLANHSQTGACFQLTLPCA